LDLRLALGTIYCFPGGILINQKGYCALGTTERDFAHGYFLFDPPKRWGANFKLVPLRWAARPEKQTQRQEAAPQKGTLLSDVPASYSKSGGFAEEQY
jgi:hypothetical protein